MIIYKLVKSYKATIDRSSLKGYNRTIYAMVLMSFLTTSISGLYYFPRSIYLNQAGISIKLYGTLVSASAGLLFLLQVFISKVSDRIKSKKKIIQIGILLNLFTNLGILLCKDIRLLSVCLIIDLAATGLCTNFYSIITSSVTDKSRSGMGFGFLKMAGSLSWAIFSALSGIILSFFPFKLLVLLVIAMNFTGLLITRFYVVEPSEVEKTNLSVPVQGSTISKKSKRNFMLVCLALLFLSCNLQSSGGLSYLSIYLKQELHTGIMLSGWILAVSGLYEIPITIIAGKLCDKYTKELVIAGGCILGASRWLIMPYIHDSRLMFLLQILHAITICTLSVCFASYVSSIVDNSKRGAFFGAFYAIGSIGSITGPALVGWIGGRNGLPAAYEVLGFVGVISGLVYLTIYLVHRKIENENSSDMFRKILDRIDG